MSVNLIGLSGKMGCGKDTVARMIQYALSPPMQANCRLEKFLQLASVQSLGGPGSPVTWETRQFAGKLKQIASLLTGIPTDRFEDQEFKKTDLPDEWSAWRVVTHTDAGRQVSESSYPDQESAELHAVVLQYKYRGTGTRVEAERVPMTVRTLLQKIGTDCLRDNLHSQVWINAMFADWRGSGRSAELARELQQQWIITDMRFPNEVDALEQHGGIPLRILRPGHHLTGEHPSETALDNHPFTHYIVNKGSLHDLYEEVERFLCKIKLL
jgi:hypothetical protein